MKAMDLYGLFAQQIVEYHKTDSVDAEMPVISGQWC